MTKNEVLVQICELINVRAANGKMVPVEQIDPHKLAEFLADKLI